MTGGPDRPGAPPEGLTARVEGTPDGIQVTLRPSGSGRWVLVVFLALWLVPWAFGEVALLGELLSLASALFGPPHATGTPSVLAPGGVPVGVALPVWLVIWAFWSVFGAGAFYLLLLAVWGADVFSLRPDGWTHWRGVGAWGRARRFTRGDVQRVRLSEADGALLVETEKGTSMLTNLGTDADRQWLCHMLSQAAGVDAIAPGGVSPSAQPRSLKPVVPPSGYRVNPLPDGTLRVAASAARRRAKGMGAFFIFALVVNGILGIMVALILMGAETSARTPAEHWVGLLIFTALALAAVSLLARFLWAALGTEEWRVSHDCLEVREAFLVCFWVRRYTNAALSLTVTVRGVPVDEHNPWGRRFYYELWRLVLQAPGARRTLDAGDPSKLRSLGAFLAEHTGWSLREVKEPEEV